MNRTDLVNSMAKNAGITKAAAKKALDGLFIDIEGALQKGNRVTIVGFGTWVVTRRAEREGRNPQTGAPLTIKAKNVIRFKTGSDLSDAIN
ncbi:MAG: HU family DNA-binding protein [Bacteroidetes bacterium]|nr:HU family DNA-binding protein [Bacteroidota bacterium]